MSYLHPHQIHRAACLWRTENGEPWLIVFSFAEIGGRIECVGMEMRSYIAFKEEASAGGSRPYESFWSGAAAGIGQLSEEEFLRLLPELGEDVHHPVAPFDPLALRAGAHRERAMLHPRPLQASTLRQLRLAEVLAQVRQQIAVQTSKLGLPTVQDRIEFERRSGASDSPGAAVLEAWVAADRELREAFRSAKHKRGHPPAYSDAHLKLAAALYRDAFERRGSLSPTKDVATELGVTRDVAAKLIRRCRRTGLLGPTEQRRAGGTRPEGTEPEDNTTDQRER